MNRKNLYVYPIVLFIFFTAACRDKNDDVGKEILSFTLLADLNGLSKDVEGKINNSEKTIVLETDEWVENMIFTPSFSSEGILTVNGVAQRDGMDAHDFESDVIYTVTDEDGNRRDYSVIFDSPLKSGLPVLKIDIAGGKEITQKVDAYENAYIKVIDKKNPEYSFEKEVGIRGRGNSTWAYPKKPWRIKFDKKTSMFGFGAEKSWVLLANYQDQTLMINTTAFEMARRLGLEFTNTSNHVELYLNGTYRGSYDLTQQLQTGGNRVNINEDEGFLVEMDVNYDEDWQFKTNHLQLPVMVKTPDITTASQMDFVVNAVNNLETTLFHTSFPNNNYKDLIDIESVINYLIVNEVAFNLEIGYPKSVYMYRDKGAKIKMGPVWDLDWGFGFNYDVADAAYFTPSPKLGFPNRTSHIGHSFFARFFDDPEFCRQYKARWNAVKNNELLLDSFIDQKTAEIYKSQLWNVKRWGVFCNMPEFDPNVEMTKMKEWIRNRINSIDSSINDL